MRNLVIGDTSQLAQYFPDDFVKISSRNLDYKFIESENWNRVFLCFGESNKFLDDIKIYDDINFYFTINLIDRIKDFARSIVVYSTCELWNQYNGKVDISMNFLFFSTPYLQSKYRLSKYLLSNASKYYNVFIIYPFNFNSPHRTHNFLFGKIFDSIINKRVIEIGDTYFYRDIVHPKLVASRSILTSSHKILGSGRLTFVNDFIRDLYRHYDMEYDKYVIENLDKYNEYDKKNEYYLNSKIAQYKYKKLLEDTIQDIDNKIKKVN